MTNSEWTMLLSELAKEYAALLGVVRTPTDPEGYPREANASRLVANALQRRQPSPAPVLEHEYLWRYTGRDEKQRKSIADVWRKRSDGPELFVELKLARLWPDGSKAIGGKPAHDIVASWASDVWYLLTLANRDAGDEVECAFIVVTFGEDVDAASIGETASASSVRDADEVYAELCSGEPLPGIEAVARFFRKATDLIEPADVVIGDAWKADPPDQQGTLDVRCLALVWRDQSPWSAPEYEFSSWSQRTSWQPDSKRPAAWRAEKG